MKEDPIERMTVSRPEKSKAKRSLTAESSSPSDWIESASSMISRSRGDSGWLFLPEASKMSDDADRSAKDWGCFPIELVAGNSVRL